MLAAARSIARRRSRNPGEKFGARAHAAAPTGAAGKYCVCGPRHVLPRDRPRRLYANSTQIPCARARERMARYLYRGGASRRAEIAMVTLFLGEFVDASMYVGKEEEKWGGSWR